MKRSSRAFTLIELLVVIAIIGVLAMTVMVALNSARDKAHYSTIAQQLREMEKAFNLLYHDGGCWPRESATLPATYCSVAVHPTAANPTIAQAIASNESNLSTYLSVAPEFPLTSTSGAYLYDNDGDEHTACNNASSARGANILVQGVDESVWSALEQIIDGTNGALTSNNRYCGKVRYNTSSSLIYSLSDTP